MRVVGIFLILFLITGCSSLRPPPNGLIVVWTADRSFYLKGPSQPPLAVISESELPPRESAIVRVPADEIGAYIRSQSYWLGSRANASFSITDEDYVKLNGAYYLRMHILLTQRQTSMHGVCSQNVFVLISLNGYPFGAYPSPLATCLV